MSVAGFRVRVCGAGDLARVVEMERTIAEAPHWGDGEYAAIVNADKRVDEAVRRCLLVAETGGRVVGFAVGKVIGSGEGSVAELESVAVDAAARRGGLGRALCQAVVDWSRRQGAEAVELEVRAGSRGAIALYRELGFVVVGRRARYYRGPLEDAVLMRLELEKPE
jgi:[ribosomal protein S18]-alanine N-acetyltransferase